MSPCVRDWGALRLVRPVPARCRSGIRGGTSLAKRVGMSTKGLLELEARNVRSMRTYGLAGMVAGVAALFLAPVGGVYLFLFGVIGGGVTVVQAIVKNRDVQLQLREADQHRVA